MKLAGRLQSSADKGAVPQSGRTAPRHHSPGQNASTSSFGAAGSVGEPSSDSGMRGLSTNFAFLRGAAEKGERERGHEYGKEPATDGST